MERILSRIISVLYRRNQVYLSDALAKYNITPSEYPFLVAVLNNDGSTQDELSLIVSVDKSAAARAIKALEDKGFVYREQDKLNRRQNRVYITEDGRKTWPVVQKELHKFEKLLTEGIDGSDLDKVYSALSQMEKNVISLINKDEEKKER